MTHPAFAFSVRVALAVMLTAPLAPAAIPNIEPALQPHTGPTSGEYWALIIGIDNYHHGPPLQTAVRDSLEVRDELAQRYGVRRDRLLELFNEQATRQNIAYALFRLSDNAKPHDIVLIYFAGHAHYDKDGRLEWWMPVEGTPLTPETLLTVAAIQEELQGMKAKQVHVFHVTAGAATELRFAQPNLRAEREALEQEQRQAEGHAQLEAARRQEEARNRLAAEQDRVEAEKRAKREGLLPREREERNKEQVERQRLEVERTRAAAEQARRVEAERQPATERRRTEEQTKASGEERAKPNEEAHIRPVPGGSPPPAGLELLGKDGAPMVLVPAGEFTMGGDSMDNPRHPVYLDAFYMDKYEATTSRYARFLHATGRQTPFKWNEVGLASHGDRPVIGVTWQDAAAYCRWAGRRLPTEAEWEKAARGSDGREYPWGNEAPTSRHANFNKCCEWKGYMALAVVGSLEAGRSPYGIYDLAGNVSEWVADWYDKTSYKYELDRNPKGPASGEEKVVRGGSWYDAGPLQRSALRSRSYPSIPSTDRGFRCAKDAE